MEDQASSLPSTSLSIAAQNSSVVVAPPVTGCQIAGPLNINVNVQLSDQQIHSTSLGVSGIGETDTLCPSPLSKVDKDVLYKVQWKLKLRLQEKLKTILEKTTETDVEDLIQPQHYITEDKGTDREHEIWRIEKASLNPVPQDKAVNFTDIFKPLSEVDKPCKTVLTIGVSGIGKTVSVQKFVFDWAEGKTNQDVDFMFLLPFWELDLLKDSKFDLQGLLSKFYPELEDLDLNVYEESKVVFVFDGLDENREFFKSEKLLDMAQASSVGALVINLITGELLPSAHIWITSRPVAARQILSCNIDRVTEIRGFGDLQKDEYFRKRTRDPNQADKMISHARSRRDLYIMCQIPSFCCIAATVLQQMIGNTVSGELPKTLTELYTFFVLNKAEDLNETSSVRLYDADAVVALGELAFKHLRDNIFITEEELSSCGIAVSEVPMHPQALTSILREEKAMIPDLKRYRFSHSGVQEFLAALYVLNSHTCWGIAKFWPIKVKELGCSAASPDSEFTVTVEQQTTLHDMLRVALDNALASGDGHLDLFLRFLLGLSLTYCHNSLSEFIGDAEHSQENIQKTVRYIRYMLKNKEACFSHPRCVNLLHCLAELKDYSFEEEMLKLLSPCGSADEQLSIAQCSVLAHLVQVSGAVFEELDVRNLCLFPEGQARLVSVIRHFKKVGLENVFDFNGHLDSLVSALASPDSQLKELDLSHNHIFDKQLTRLCPALQSSRLQSLNLSHVQLSVLVESVPELDGISLFTAECYFHILDSFQKTTSGLTVKTCEGRILHALVSGPDVQLHSLKLKDFSLSDDSCEILASALQSANSRLKELDLSYNDLTDTRVQKICQKLRHPNCVLEILRLNGCSISEVSCKTLRFVLPGSYLKELHLGSHGIGDNGLKHLSVALQTKPMLTSLGLSDCNLTGDSCEALASALSSESSALRELDLSNNDLGDSGLKLLSTGLESPHCKLEILRLSGCMITEEGCSSLASALTSNPSHLRELDLSYNHPGESGEKLLSAKLEDPNCKLETLDVNNGGAHRMKPGLRKYACDFGNFLLTPQNSYEWEKILGDFLGLSERRFYWQVEWTGCLKIGVQYKDKKYCNKWFLHCSGRGYYFNSSAALPIHHKHPKQLGVYLDYPAGMLSFYEVSSDKIKCLQRAHHKFVKPLYLYFAPDYSRNCSVKMQTL